MGDRSPDQVARATASEKVAEVSRAEVEAVGPEVEAVTGILGDLLDSSAPPGAPADGADAGPAPDPPKGLGRSSAGVVTPAFLATLQRTGGNASAKDLAQRVSGRQPLQRSSPPVTVQRAGNVALTGIGLTNAKVTIPLAGALTARAKPANASDVSFSVEKDTVDPTGVTIDSTTGAITIDGTQQGGRITVKVTGLDGAWFTTTLQIIEKPTGIASTSASGAMNYGGQFTHTFSAPSGKSSGLDQGNINEKFASTSAATPWGGNFTLSANAAGSRGWDLDSSGTMAGPDNVDIGATGVDVGPFVKSASNPTPKGSLPQGFTMSQALHAKTFPGGALDATAFTTVPHKRTLIAGPKFEVEAGKKKITEDYSGPAAVTNAKASAPTVMASAPKPKSGTWAQNKVTITADAIPATGTKTFSITGKALGCTVDANGEVSIGSLAGTITVRVSASPKNFDEATVTITEYVAPKAAPATPGSPAPKANATDDEEGAVPTIEGAEPG